MLFIWYNKKEAIIYIVKYLFKMIKYKIRHYIVCLLSNKLSLAPLFQKALKFQTKNLLTILFF